MVERNGGTGLESAIRDRETGMEKGEGEKDKKKGAVTSEAT